MIGVTCRISEIGISIKIVLHSVILVLAYKHTFNKFTIVLYTKDTQFYSKQK